jgi:hypothetical protein
MSAAVPPQMRALLSAPAGSAAAEFAFEAASVGAH